MSPEAGKPEAQTQTGSNEFVQGTEHPTDGVRPFGRGDLPEVADQLLERGVPDTVPIDPETLEVPIDKVPLETEQAATKAVPPTETTEPLASTSEEAGRKSRKGLLVGLGSAAAGVAVTAAAFLGLSGNSEAPKATPAASATPTPGETPPAPAGGESEPVSTSVIENLSKPSTKEQIEYVINNPVSVEKFPDPIDALVELGKHSNVLYLANPDTFGPEESNKMYESIYDNQSPYYQGTKESMDRNRKIIAADFILQGDILQASVSFQPTDRVAETSPEGTVINTNIVYSGNIKELMGGNEQHASDFNVDMVLTNDGTNWRIYAAHNATPVGDIG